MAEYHVVTIAVPGKELARAIADKLLADNLAASVQILGPIESHYWWQGATRQAEEYLCICKSRPAVFGRLESAVCAMHPYVTPEIFATPIAAAGTDYLAWIDCYTTNQVDS